jgi:UDPglucose 6-dehydrogenase
MNDYQKRRFADNMTKSAFVFDGRNVLDKDLLEGIGFKYKAIGR